MDEVYAVFCSLDADKYDPFLKAVYTDRDEAREQITKALERNQPRHPNLVYWIETCVLNHWPR